MRSAGPTTGGADEVLNRLGVCIAEARTLTFDLSPPVLEDAGLAAALRWLARQMKDRYDLAVSLVHEDLADVVGGETRALVFQAVRELLFNVVKHSGNSEARVAIALAGKNRLRLSVSDHGVVFDPKATSSVENPLGFGLFSIRERLRLLGGEMTVDSRPGHGTSINLELPRRAAGDGSRVGGGAGANGAGQRSSAGAPPSDGPSRRIRILLADDHPAMRHGLAVAFEREADVEVVGEGSSGDEGIRLAAALRPDIVLMDVAMPGMNGFEATALIHRSLPGICVIGLSMHEEGEVGQKMREAGAVDYVSKNAPIDDLMAMVRTAYARARSGSPEILP